MPLRDTLELNLAPATAGVRQLAQLITSTVAGITLELDTSKARASLAQFQKTAGDAIVIPVRFDVAELVIPDPEPLDIVVDVADDGLAAVERAIADLDAQAVTVDVGADAAGLESAARQVADLDAAAPTVELDLDFSDLDAAMEGLARLDAAAPTVRVGADDGELDETLRKVADLAGEGATVKVRSDDGDLDTTLRKVADLDGAAPTIKPNVDSSQLDAFKDKLDNLSAAATGVAIGGGLTAGIASSFNAEVVTDRLGASLGATPAEAERYGKLASELYRGAWGESLDEVAGAIGAVVRTTKDLGTESEASLGRITPIAMDIASTFDKDLNEVLRAAGQLVRNDMAPNIESALDLLTTGFQGGADRADDFLDTINEYTPAFARLGLTGPDALKLIDEGLQAGAFNSDKLGDAINEFSIRAIDGSKGSTDALAKVSEALGLGADGALNLQQAIAGGGDAGAEAFRRIVEGLGQIKDPLERDAAGVALFGSMWEDMGEGVILSLTGAGGSVKDFAGQAKELSDTVNDNLGTRLSSLVREGLGGISDILNATLLPVIDKVLGFFEKIGVSGGTVATVIGGIVIAIGGLATVGGIVAAVAAGFAGLVGAVSSLAPLFAVLTGPIGLTVAAVAGLAAGFVLAYQNIEPFRAAVDGLVAVVGGFASNFVTQLGNAWEVLRSGEDIAQGLGETLDAAFGNTGRLVGPIRDLVVGFLELGTAARPAIEGVTQLISGLWDMIRSLDFSGLVGGIQTLLGGVASGLASAFGGVANLLGSLASAIAPAVQAVASWFRDELVPAVLNLQPAFQAVVDAGGAILEFIGTLAARAGQLVGIIATVIGKVIEWVAGFEPLRAVVGFIAEQIGGVVITAIEYFGQALGTVAGVVKTVFEALTSLLNGDLGRVGEFFAGIGRAVGDVATAIGGALLGAFTTAAGAIGTAMGAIRTAIEVGWQVITTVVQAAVAVLGPVVSAAWDAISASISTVMSVITTAIQGGWQIITTVVQTAMAVLGPIVQAGWEAISTVVSTVMRTVESVVTAAWDAIRGAVETAMNVIRPLVETAWNAIKDTVTTVLGAIKDVVVRVWDEIKDKVTTVLDAIKDTAQRIWNAIKDTVTEQLNAIRDVAVRIWEEIKDKIQTALEAIKETAERIWRAIKDTVTEQLNAIRDLVVRVWDEIKENVRSSLEAIRQVAETVWSAIKTTVQTAVDGVKLAIEGGFNAAKGIVETAMSAAKGAVDLFKDALNLAKGPIETVTGLLRSGFDGIGGIVSGALGGVTSAIDSVRDAAAKAYEWVASLIRKLGEVNPLSALSKLNPFADGGLVLTPTAALIGEAGPELVLPLTRSWEYQRDLLARAGVLDRLYAEMARRTVVPTPTSVSHNEATYITVPVTVTAPPSRLPADQWGDLVGRRVANTLAIRRRPL